MAVTVADLLAIIDGIAPPELQEDYDNVGLLAGRPGQVVNAVLTALDLTDAVIDEAVSLGVQLIVTHHPILFRARKNLREDDPEGALLCKLIRSELSLIAAHTNFDNAAWGVSDALAEALELLDISPLPNGLRVGRLDGSMAAHKLGAYVGAHLGGVPRTYLAGDRPVARVAVCGGAGGSFYDLAAQAGADAYVTGEVRHHEALAAAAVGIHVIEAGHLETERVGIYALADCLQNRLNALQYKVSVMKSAVVPFGR